MATSETSALKYPYGQPELSARIKLKPEDFRVSENLGFELTGSGEHLFLYIQKTALTTQQLIEQLAKSTGIHPRHIGYSGLKDKQAVTQQWISLHLPGLKQSPDIPDTDVYQVLKSQWHDKKLRVGVHRSNYFDVTLRNVTGDINRLHEVVDKITHHGMANYFGLQRFGQQQDNVAQALKVLSNRHRKKRLSRHKKSLYLSALRSELFNRILSTRIELGLWGQPVPGDLYMLAGSQSLFSSDIDQSIVSRYAEFDIHSALSLYGSGETRVDAQAGSIENDVFDACADIRDTLIDNDLKRSYRASRAIPQGLRVTHLQDEKVLNLQVELGKGVYLTTLLEHCVNIIT